MADTYDRDGLEKLGIYELRNVARKVGVSCPTMKKKEDLISSIVGIITGVQKPDKKINKQGRPAKEISSLKEMLDIFVPVKKDKVIDFHNKIILSGSVDVLMQSAPEVLPGEEDALDVEGLLHIYVEGYGSIYNKQMEENIYVPAPHINFYGLKEGDLLKGLFKPHGKDELLVLIKITSVNNYVVDCMQTDSQNFSEIPARFADIKLPLCKNNSDDIDFRIIDAFCPIGKGNKCLFITQQNYDKIEFIKELSYRFAIFQNTKTLLLCPDELSENVDYMSNPSKNLIMLNKNFSIANYNNNYDFYLCYEYFMRLAEQMEDVVIIIEDLEKLINQFTNYYAGKGECSQMQAKIKAINKIKHIILNSKQSLEQGSITLFVFANENDENLNQIQNMVNNKIYLNNEKNLIKSYLDLQKSYCTKPQNLLTKTEYKNYLAVWEEKDEIKQQNIIKNILKI